MLDKVGVLDEAEEGGLSAGDVGVVLMEEQSRRIDLDNGTLCDQHGLSQAHGHNALLVGHLTPSTENLREQALVNTRDEH